MTEVPDIPWTRSSSGWCHCDGKLLWQQRLCSREAWQEGLEGVSGYRSPPVAATFKQLGLEEPEGVAMAIATNDKNLFGSLVEVAEGDGFVEIRRLRCGQMEGAKSFARVGANLIAREHCKTCIESHWQKVLSELKMNLEVEHTDEGCIMRISKQKA